MIYTAFTIGPILKTLQSVKSTKAIWSASYTFSYLIKQVIIKLKEKDKDIKFILPYSGKIELENEKIDPFKDKLQTGLFPDRIIIEGSIELQETIDSVLNNFSKEAKISFDYLNNYINCYHLKIDLIETSNVILEINNLLDSLELQQRIIENTEKDHLTLFFEKIQPYNFLINEEFEERPFPSTIEIATLEFSDNEEYNTKALPILKARDDEEGQTKFIKEVKAIVGKQFRNYQKYIAVVQADGDNIGKFIEYLYKLENKKEKEKFIERFSKNLLSFAIEAVQLIKHYNGTPVYAGGDDLLYFMPVARTTIEGNQIIINKTVFSLISEIDEIFNEYFTNYNEDNVDFKSLIDNADKEDQDFKKPTMSYGVSISYYKFPLNQALEEGVNQLFYTAKKTDNKNAVSFTILKHSGQSFGATFNKAEQSYKTFSNLISTPIEKEEFIKSIIQKLDPQKAVLMAIGGKTQPEREKMIDNFFMNNFNESIHRKKNNRDELIPFLEQAKMLIKNVYDDNPLIDIADDKKKNDRNDENTKKIYSALRFTEFIHNKEERE